MDNVRSPYECYWCHVIQYYLSHSRLNDYPYQAFLVRRVAQLPAEFKNEPFLRRVNDHLSQWDRLGFIVMYAASTATTKGFLVNFGVHRLWLDLEMDWLFRVYLAKTYCARMDIYPAFNPYMLPIYCQVLSCAATLRP